MSGTGSLIRRVIRAQESGLVLVIALMMAALTFFGGTKPQFAIIQVPAGFTVTLPDEKTAIVTPVDGGAPVRHVSDTGWRHIKSDDGSSVLRGSVTVNRFFERENLVNITTKASFYAVMAVGMTAIIILAGIDLSVGSIYALSAVLGAMVLLKVPADTSVWVAVPVTLLVCCSVGAIAGGLNGAMSVGLRVHPFIITLGTMAVYRGVVFVITRGQTQTIPSETIQTQFFKAPYGHVYPVPTIIMLIVAAIGVFVLRSTVFGRRVYAIGGNETAAMYAGIPVGRVKIAVYALAGMLAGLSAAMYFGYFGAAESNAGSGYELQVIAAAVIGGASLSGGRGSALGAVLGAILVQLLENTMLILDIPQSFNQIVMGAAIVIAVVVDQAKARFSK